MLPTKRDQMIECMENIEWGMTRMNNTRDIWQNNLIFWICKALLLLLEKEVKK